jgi:hypothetical protein
VRHLNVGARCLAFVALAAAPAYAQSPQEEAERLFEEGRDLLVAGDSAAACPKLEESQRLDPANGTLLALAMCHEAEGKLASAWREFTQVAEFAARDGQTDRQLWATQHAAELRSRLSTIELRVPKDVRELPNLVVTLNDEQLSTDAWDVASPVDGGDYYITIRADGYAEWNRSVSIAKEGEQRVVVVPLLRSDESDSSSTAVGAVGVRPASEPMSVDGLTTLQWAGVASAGVGVAAWIAGGVTLYMALDKKDKALGCEHLCRYNLQGEAMRYGNWSTGFAIGGAAAVLAGAGLYFFGQSPTIGDSQAMVDIDVQPTSASLTIRGVL